jgi:rhodanese-related sulfurtransferase
MKLFQASAALVVLVALVLSARMAGAVPAPKISLQQFTALHASSDPLVIDVRESSSYRIGHIARAINVPLLSVQARADEIATLARGKTVVTYCSCPDEYTSALAALILVEHKIEKVYALIGGYPAWVKSGGATEKN